MSSRIDCVYVDVAAELVVSECDTGLCNVIVGTAT